MTSRSVRTLNRLRERSIVSDLPVSEQARWLESFARLYRDVVAAARNKNRASKRGYFQVAPTSWKIKLAMIRHTLTVHRYKDSNNQSAPPPVYDSHPDHVVEDRSEETLPSWIIDEFESFADNEPSLWPTRDFLSKFGWYKIDLNIATGRLYFESYSSLLNTNVDVVVIAPWLKRGGADKGVLQFLEYYSTKYNVLLITTLEAESPWLSKVPRGVQVIELGNKSTDINECGQLTVLTRLLVELKPVIIHNVNSDLGWRCFTEHGTALRSNNSKLIASAFSEEIMPTGHRFGYAITYLTTIRENVDLLVTDNTVYRDVLRRRYHLPNHRVRHVHFWHLLERSANTTPLRGPLVKDASVLFAGRLCYEKRPDILYKIALECRDVEFHVFGESDKTKFASKWRSKLAALPNVWLYGGYNGFDSIAESQKFRAFLYTTAFDGLPNVLLEAASYRIPIVAPGRIGGLADLVGAETAFTVEEADEADSYVRALRMCLSDPAGAEQRAQNAFDLVQARHSREAFTTSMDEALLSAQCEG